MELPELEKLSSKVTDYYNGSELTIGNGNLVCIGYPTLTATVKTFILRCSTIGRMQQIVGYNTEGFGIKLNAITCDVYIKDKIVQQYGGRFIYDSVIKNLTIHDVRCIKMERGCVFLSNVASDTIEFDSDNIVGYSQSDSTSWGATMFYTLNGISKLDLSKFVVVYGGSVNWNLLSGEFNNLRVLILPNNINGILTIITGEHKKLIHIESVGISYAMYLGGWYPSNALDSSQTNLIEDPSICSNNLEQFLYNFREYIVKRLATMSGRTKIYLHATTKSFIVGEDSSEYAKTWVVPGEYETYLTSLEFELSDRNWELA